MLKVYESIDHLCPLSSFLIFESLFATPLLRDIFIRKILNGFIFLVDFFSFFFNITFLLLLRMIYENAVYRFFIVKDLLKIVFIFVSVFYFETVPLQCHLFYLFISSTDYRIFLLLFLRIIRIIFSYLYHGIIFKITNIFSLFE